MSDDLISRRAALETLKMDIKIIPFAKAREYAEAVLGEAENRIKALPSAQQWIPVTEALPLKCEDVLITDGESCEVAYWNEDAKAWDSAVHGWVSKYMEEIVAWVPLPELRKGDSDD